MTEKSAPTRPKNKRRLWIIAIAAIVIIAGVFVGSRIYAANVSAEAEAVPTLSAPTNAGASSTSGAASGTIAATDRNGTWSVGSGSYAGYRLDEVLNGADVTVTGRTEDVSGSLTVKDEKLTAADLKLQVDTITTDSDRRDSYFRTSAIDTSQFPEATFALTKPVDVSATLDGDTKEFEITGDLTLNGQTVSVTSTVQGAFSDGSAQLVGQIPMTWEDFGVEAPNLGFVSVEDTGFIEYSLNVTQG
ncbi:YceI family protein [Paeniglutamicibacter terrestris]|uniref:YceI family protein n=1 Tax=Paeniglutamicibacter terrestris TaxID=2723403 RepID=A0ABX1G7R0_9MICC|nr:YceI family protein [Paeniglutamicibacter terrestris]NKG22043.1 YceI family protein [Paeniglutamicibacter terrestris]